MPIVDDNRLKGNLAAFAVATWLSRGCLVRPVAEGTDVGIDLFCETVDRSSQEPFLHFWVQVKTGKQVAVDDGLAHCSFKIHHIRYWMRQPVPVYIFLVSEEQLTQLNCVHVISLVRAAMSTVIPPHQDSLTLKSNLCYSTQRDPYGLGSFLETSVRVDHVLLQACQGVSVPLPQLKPGYCQESITGVYARSAFKCIEQVRRSATSTMRDLLNINAPSVEQKQQITVLAAVLRPYTQGISEKGYQKQHYEDYWVMGLYEKRFGDPPAGEGYLRRAITIIREDEEFKKSNPQWELLITEIEKSISTSDHVS